MLVEVEDNERLVERVAALDIGKAEVVWCVRLPGTGTSSKRMQEVGASSTTTRSLIELSNKLVEYGVTRVTMEATSSYWKPVYYLLEAHGLDVWLVNPRDVKNLPGRPKTDKLDAVWLCKCTERQMVRPSFVPPPPIRALRDLTRYRTSLVRARNSEKNRVEKLLADACIQLSVVASDIFGVSGRDMMNALIVGERDPKKLAQFARTRLRGKLSELEEAMFGHFTDHHAFLLECMLSRVDGLNAQILKLEARIETTMAPFARDVARLIEVPGIGIRAASILIAEIGTDMSFFPTPEHLGSWAKFTPTVKQSAGKSKGRAKTGRGNNYLAAVLGEIAVAIGRTDTHLGERYRRLRRRKSGPQAVVATGRAVLTVYWHLMSDPDARFHDLGADFLDNRVTAERQKQTALRALRNLGYEVDITKRDNVA